MIYNPKDTVARFDHRGLWCENCRDQCAHYRPHKSTERWRCCDCEHVQGLRIDHVLIEMGAMMMKGTI